MCLGRGRQFQAGWGDEAQFDPKGFISWLSHHKPEVA